MKVKMGIRTKILTLFLATLFGILVVLMYLVTSQSKNAVQETILQTSQIVMKTAGSLVREELSAKMITVEDLASDAVFVDGEPDEEAVGKVIKAYEKKDVYKEIGYTDKKGITQTGEDLSEKEFYIRAKEEQKAVVSEVYQTEDGELEVLFAAPVIKSNGAFDGIVYGISDCKLLSELLSGVSIGTQSYAFMLDSSGSMIASTNYNWVKAGCNFLTGVNPTDVFDTKIMAGVSNSMISALSSHDVFQIGQDNVFAVYTPVEVNGWSICVCGSIEEFMSGYYEGVQNIFIVMIVIFVLIGIYVAALGTKMARPIKKSTDRMLLLAKGDLHAEVSNIKTLDETYILQKAIASTIDTLNNMISEVADILERMAGGDFTAKIDSEFVGDLLPLKEALNKILVQMRMLLREIGATSNQVLFGAQNVAQLSETLASMVTEQTAIMDNIKENVSSISYGADVNAKSAKEAASVTSQAMTHVEEGSCRMEELIDAMEKMEKSSQAIEKINKTVADIAFQTNILALNASVEAARAGTAGKGFAVVAEEVKSLAEKSAIASQDSAELIQDTVAAIENSMSIAKKTADSMKKVVEHTKEADGHIGEIAIMSEEQLNKLAQIEKSINEIADALSSTAASTQESAATAEELNTQAHTLEKMIQKFKV